jgi:hypothetical protein
MPAEKKESPIAVRLVITSLIAVALVYIFYTSFFTHRFRVRVCVSYHGASSCQVALGHSRHLALRAAHDLACSQISYGRAGTIGCQDTPATSVTWLKP